MCSLLSSILTAPLYPGVHSTHSWFTLPVWFRRWSWWHLGLLEGDSGSEVLGSSVKLDILNYLIFTLFERQSRGSFSLVFHFPLAWNCQSCPGTHCRIPVCVRSPHYLSNQTCYSSGKLESSRAGSWVQTLVWAVCQAVPWLLCEVLAPRYSLFLPSLLCLPPSLLSFFPFFFFFPLYLPFFVFLPSF